MSGNVLSPRAERHPLTEREVLRCAHGGRERHAEPDAISVEEPLEIRLAGDAFATVMRTPGEDHLLVAGFLFSEGIIRDLGDLGRVATCGRPSEPGYGNVVDVAPGPGTAFAPEQNLTRRGTITGSACGVCGRERIDDLLARLGPLTDDRTLPVAHIAHSLVQLQNAQRAFARTGAVHGALVCDEHGVSLAASEDVGRHNAVDKVIGKLLHSGDLSRSHRRGMLLCVSGRTSFEIVQKAAAAHWPVIVSVSAPTSLAIDLAATLGLTLVGFARAEAFNVYSHAERIRWSE